MIIVDVWKKKIQVRTEIFYFLMIFIRGSIKASKRLFSLSTIISVAKTFPAEC